MLISSEHFQNCLRKLPQCVIGEIETSLCACVEDHLTNKDIKNRLNPPRGTTAKGF